jgi:hypothetical protein
LRYPKFNKDAAKARPVSEIGSEAPIRKKSEDRLGTADFADRIAGVEVRSDGANWLDFNPRSAGWKPLVNPVKSAPPSEKLTASTRFAVMHKKEADTPLRPKRYQGHASPISIPSFKRSKSKSKFNN